MRERLLSSSQVSKWNNGELKIPSRSISSSTISPIIVGSWANPTGSADLPAWSFDSQADDLLIVWGSSYDAGRLPTTITASGLTFTAVPTNTGSYTRAYWAWLPDSTKRALDFTWSEGGSWQAAYGTIFRGVHRASPFDGLGASGDLGSTNPRTVPGITTTYLQSLSFVSTIYLGSSTNALTQAGWTSGFEFNSGGANLALVTASKTMTEAGATGTVSFTNPSTRIGGYTHFALRGIDRSLGDQPRSLFSATDPGTPSVDSDASAINVGVEFYVAEPSLLKEIRFWQPASGGSLSTRYFGLWDITAGAFVAYGPPVTPNSGQAGSWVSSILEPKILLTPYRRYKAIVLHPVGVYTYTSLYWSSGPGTSGIDKGLLRAPNSAFATSPGQSTFVVSESLANTTNTFNHSNYWIDVLVERR
jgi:Domain of unknown function (DUF4082)